VKVQLLFALTLYHIPVGHWLLWLLHQKLEVCIMCIAWLNYNQHWAWPGRSYSSDLAPRHEVAKKISTAISSSIICWEIKLLVSQLLSVAREWALSICPRYLLHHFVVCVKINV